jgi:hypothetical protein
VDHTKIIISFHLLRLICMPFDAQSAPTESLSLFARKEKRKKYFLEKEFPETVVAGRLVVLRSTRSTTSADRCKTGTPTATGPYHKAQVLPPASADLHAVRRQSAPTESRSPCARKEKRKK